MTQFSKNIQLEALKQLNSARLDYCVKFTGKQGCLQTTTKMSETKKDALTSKKNCPFVVEITGIILKVRCGFRDTGLTVLVVSAHLQPVQVLTYQIYNQRLQALCNTLYNIPFFSTRQYCGPRLCIGNTKLEIGIRIFTIHTSVHIPCH